MSENDTTGTSAGQQALLRILRVAIPDDERRKRAIDDALRSADLDELPDEADALLRFVRAHLVPRLTGHVPARLIAALVDPVGNARRAAKLTPPPESELKPTVTPFPKLRQSVRNLVRTTSSSKFRAAPPVAAAPGKPADARTPTSVLLVHPDRVLRASLARALIKARFDVSVFDAAAQVPAAVQGPGDGVIVIVDVRAKTGESELRTLAGALPSARLVAWSEMAPPETEVMLRRAGATSFRVVPRAASDHEVLDNVHKLLAAASTGE